MFIIDFLLLLIQFIGQSLYLALPAIAANSTPPIAARYRFLPALDLPIDFNKTFRGKAIFGDHKTIRGYVVGIPSAIIVTGLQYLLFTHVDFFRFLSVVNFAEVSWVMFGFMVGLGTLVGDSVKSFFKRQAGVAPGVSWVPWDQLDSVIGAVTFAYLVSPIPWQIIVTLIFVGPALHFSIDSLGYMLGIKK